MSDYSEFYYKLYDIINYTCLSCYNMSISTVIIFIVSEMSYPDDALVLVGTV